MKGCDSTVTVWRRRHDDANGNRVYFEREVLPVLCAWQRQSGRRLTASSGSGAGVAARNGVTVIIPYIGDIGGFALNPGDLLALGEHDTDDTEITGERPYRENDVKTALGENMITVSSVAHNLRGRERGKHLKIEGV